ncbi:PREDICTED: uncharacterized protein LOC109192673 [Ipomoea nil]|uniref:uncharacterized protein LOC109192673 n=1 Tax=Ipomoea nil TaxID=35883 RepID=UPI000901BB9B|nr:PREDICTED: uncharacterized protein LOC109192673 [Ipomoea nil]
MEISETALSQRSSEDLDLLVRSTKKAKRSEPLRQVQTEKGDTVDHGMADVEVVHETPADMMVTSDHAIAPELCRGEDPAPLSGNPVAPVQQVTPRRTYADNVVGHNTADHAPCNDQVISDSSSDESEPEEDDDPLCPTIRLTKKEIAAIRAPWKKTLIIKVMGRKVGYAYLKRRLTSMWKPQGHMDLIAIANDYFLVRFGTTEDLEFAMYEGPWMILDHYLIVKPWEPDFDPYNDTTEKVLVWVCVPDLPAEYFDCIFLRKLGNRIGKIIRVDQATSLISRGMFARICVELDMRKPLVSKFTYGGKIRHMAYEGVHLVCFSCGLYGHTKETCPALRESVPEPGAATTAAGASVNARGRHPMAGQNPNATAEILDPKIPFGTWMLAPTRRGRGGAKPQASPKRHTAGQGVATGDMEASLIHESTFAPLLEDEVATEAPVQAEEEQDQGAGVNAEKETGRQGRQSQMQGAGGRPFLRALKYLLRTYKPGVLGLFEPKISGTHANSVCMQLGFSDWIRVEAVGFSGGIWVFWKDPVQLTVISTHPQFILLQVKEAGQEPWYIAPVYGSPAHYLRKRLWRDLTHLNCGINGPWLIAGDFNSTTCREETLNYSSYSAHRCADFVNWIQDEGLIDLGFSGPPLTWMKDGQNRDSKGGRLDRALCNSVWRTRFPEARVTHLARIASDHAPIFLQVLGERRSRPVAPFTFQAAWLTRPNIHDMVHRTWRTDRGFIENTKILATELSTWNKESFGNIFRRKKILLSRLSGIQKVQAHRYHKGLASLETKLKAELEMTLHQEELLWYQKSREEWISSGDRNTTYYHAAATVRKSRSSVHRLLDDNGVWISDASEMRSHVRNFYSQLFLGESNGILGGGLHANFPRLREIDWACFNRAVSKEEVHNALKDMKPFKAPGPDGFQAGFYQHMWPKTGDDVFRLVQQAFLTGVLPEGLNDTLIALIPKVKGPETIKQFRPISLCNVSYKIITKTITNRLKLILPKIVGPYQSSFVPGRQITDNVLIFQEVMHTMRGKQGAKGYMAIKLDLEKAYDRLSWDFIQDTLEQAGFTGLLKDLMMTCIRTPTLSILWGGERLEPIRPTRGIRQGDAMSPAIFVLCMERLSQLITSAVENQVWKGIKLASNGPVLTHLCFADDMVLFTEVSVAQIEVVKNVLDRFCAASGQRISLNKSQVLFSKNTVPGLADDLTRRLNIARTMDFGKYLGVPAIHGRVTCNTFSDLLTRINSRLEGWKAKNLSLAGRVVLAKSVLNAIPIYTMQTTALPKSLCLEIEKRTRKFIWDGNDTVNKMSLANWDLVTTAKEAGGLGLLRLCDMNRACMVKLAWRIKNDSESLWARVMTTKYRCPIGTQQVTQGRKGVSNAWRGIAEAWDFMTEHLTHVVRNGMDTQFWMGKWISPEPLYVQLRTQLALPDLYAPVRDYWDEMRGWKWELLEDALPTEMKARLASFVLTEEHVPDALGWDLDPKGMFTVRSAYSAIVNGPIDNTDGSWKRMWRIRVPARICMLLWLVLHGKILTNAERARRKLTSNPFCFRCAGHPEDLNHLFRTCPAAKQVWDAALTSRTRERLDTLPWDVWLETNLRGNGMNGFSDHWRESFCIRLWWLWRWRNDEIFKQQSRTLGQKLEWIANYELEVLAAYSKRIHPEKGTENHTPDQVRWRKPARGWVKLNIDGCCKAKDMAGCGGLLRDENGTWLTGFTCNIGRCSAYEAELWGMLHGLCMARRRGITKLIAESDSAQLISDLRPKSATSDVTNNLLWRCMREASAFSEITFEHTFREGNIVADMIAATALDHQIGYRDLSEPPLALCESLKLDQLEAATRRHH